jgi:DNA polymerase-1
MAEIVSARGKWYKPYPAMTAPDGRLRTTFRQGTVVTGRLSAERFQAHAIPHDWQLKHLTSLGVQPIRYGFIARPGCVLCEVDVAQAEIRVATAIAKCSQMLRLIRQGTDSHSAAALLMFYPRGTSLAEAQSDENWAFNRGVPAKRCNLGILYGGGVGAVHAAILKFAGLDIAHDTIRDWIADWRRAFPPFVQTLDGYSDLAARQGWVTLIDGQVRYFSEYDPTHKAFNAVIQNAVAVAIERSLIEFDRLHPGVLLLQIHDSLVLEVPKDRVAEIVSACAEILVRHFEKLFRPVPFEADVKYFGRDSYITPEAIAR